MRAVHVIDSVDELKALSAPQRLALLRHLVDGARSATELAELMNDDKRRLYYHLGELEKLGLIEVVDQVLRRNLVEKIYRATARYYRVDRGLFRGVEGIANWLRSVESLLDTTTADLRTLARGFEHASHSSGVDGDGNADDGAASDRATHPASDAFDPADAVYSTHRGLRIPATERAAFVADLEALLARWAPDDGGAGDARVTIVAYPAPDVPVSEAE